MKYQCTKCNRVNYLSGNQKSTDYLCYRCETRLPSTPLETSGDTSVVVCLIGGAALGGSIAGPVGAIMGALIGNLIGKKAAEAG